MSDIKVSIAIPFYNATRTLGPAIKSVLAQTFDNWELILIDDGSSDCYQDILNKVYDSRLRLVSNTRNQGLSRCLNQAAQIARGQYVARMDADDIMHPRRIEKQVAFLDANPEIDVCGSYAYIISSSNELLGVRKRDHAFTSMAILTSGLFIHPTVMGKAEWFRDNPYDESLERAQDYELWCRTEAFSNFEIIPEPLLFYRVETKASKGNKLAQSYQAVRKTIREYGPSKIGCWRSQKLAMVYLLKELAMRLTTATRTYYLLETRRFQAIEHEEALEAQRLLTALVLAGNPTDSSAFKREPSACIHA